jgi:hypothetical protein
MELENSVLRPQKEISWIMEVVMAKSFPFCILLYSPPDLFGLCQPAQLLSSMKTELLCNWRGIRKYTGGESTTADGRCGRGSIHGTAFCRLSVA